MIHFLSVPAVGHVAVVKMKLQLLDILTNGNNSQHADKRTLQCIVLYRMCQTIKSLLKNFIKLENSNKNTQFGDL